MRRAAPWLLAAAGALLVVLGSVLVIRGPRVPAQLMFLSPEQYAELLSAHRWVEAGRTSLAVGSAVLAGATGWVATRRRWTAIAVAVGSLGTLLVVAGLLMIRWQGGHTVTTYAGSYAPLCADLAACGTADGLLPPHAVHWVGLGCALLGGLLLGCVVARSRRGEQRPDVG